MDAIFGVGSINFNLSKPDTDSNAVLGALAKQTGFAEFKSNFEARLRRLNSAIVADSSLRDQVLDSVKRIAGPEWDGAHAELCALDYFLAMKDAGPGQIELDRTVPASDTLASELGSQNANHDVRLSGLGVSMDTKNLSDKTGQILENVFQRFRAVKGIKHLAIVPSYDLDEDFEPYKRNFQQLLDELVNGVDVVARPATLQSKIIPGLSYQFAWDAGVYSSANSYSAIEHATRHHVLLFGHIKKFSRVEPTVIVYVLFPWSGERAFLFDDGKPDFMRELGRKFFTGYVGSAQLAKAYNKAVCTSITAYDVTRHLSGVIYLDDKSITATDPTQTNVAASFIWNPNAVHTLRGHALEAALKQQGAIDLDPAA